MAPCVRCNSSPARPKCWWRAAALKQRSAFSGGRRVAEGNEFFFVNSIHRFGQYALVLSRRAGVLTALGIGLGVWVHLGYALLGVGVLMRHRPGCLAPPSWSAPRT